jgi:hypothetical protein
MKQSRCFIKYGHAMFEYKLQIYLLIKNGVWTKFMLPSNNDYHFYFDKNVSLKHEIKI